MIKSNKFSPEVRERAVRMVQEHQGEYPSLWAAVESIASKIGCVPQTLLTWVQRHEVDTGARPPCGVSGASTACARTGWTPTWSPTNRTSRSRRPT
jgi:transposase-like protein